jgi:hypothetical protein
MSTVNPKAVFPYLMQPSHLGDYSLEDNGHCQSEPETGPIEPLPNPPPPSQEVDDVSEYS